MYLVVNVENLKLYEPPFIMDMEEVGQVPIVDGFSPEYLDNLLKDIILDRRTRTSLWGDMEYLRIAFMEALWQIWAVLLVTYPAPSGSLALQPPAV